MAQSLNDTMEFDHVVTVRNGVVTDGPAGVYAPESLITTDNDGQVLKSDEEGWIESITSQGWQLMYGSAQNSSPIFHPSEFIGGKLAEYILGTDGLYVAITVETLNDSDEAVGWAVAYRELPQSPSPARVIESMRAAVQRGI